MTSFKFGIFSVWNTITFILASLFLLVLLSCYHESKLLGPIIYPILCTLLNNRYAKYVYNNRDCSIFLSKPYFNEKMMNKIWIPNKWHKNGIVLLRLILKFVTGEDNCITTLTPLLIEVILCWQIRKRLVFILISIIFVVCFDYCRYITCGLNKPEKLQEQN